MRFFITKKILFSILFSCEFFFASYVTKEENKKEVPLIKPLGHAISSSIKQLAKNNKSKIKSVFKKKEQKQVKADEVKILAPTEQINIDELLNKVQLAYDSLNGALENYQTQKNSALKSTQLALSILTEAEKLYESNEDLNTIHERREHVLYRFLQVNITIFERKKGNLEVETSGKLREWGKSVGCIFNQLSVDEKKIFDDIGSFKFENVNPSSIINTLLPDLCNLYNEYKTEFLDNIDFANDKIKKIDEWRLNNYPNAYNIPKIRTEIFAKIRQIRGY